jgi:cardiolipin synthase
MLRSVGMAIEAKSPHQEEQWKEETLYQDGDSFFDSIFDSIRSARHAISIETYIFDRDPLGFRILHALSDAADRGVKVRLLLDGAGCSEWDHEDTDPWRKKNFEIRFFHPLLWQRRNRKFWKYLNLRRVIRGLGLLNHRNHRKVFLFDDETAFIGSMNVSERHLSSSTKQKTWRDSSVRIHDPRITILHESFDEAWNYFENYRFRYFRKSKVSEGTHLLFLNRTIRQRRRSYHALIQRLSLASQSIRITNPYFIPTLRMRRILKVAASKGISTTLLFPSISDVLPVKRAMEGFYASLLKTGIRIFEYQPSMIHAKVLLTDQEALLGTTNLNSRSLFFDLEVDVEITHPDNIQALQSAFTKDLESAKAISLAAWKKRPLTHQMIENFFLLFRWML